MFSFLSYCNSYKKISLGIAISFLLCSVSVLHFSEALGGDLVWPIDCVPGDGTCYANIGYPDINSTNIAHDCGLPGYYGHQGTDISITQQAMLDGTAVFSSTEGTVLWVFDGKYDQCPSIHPDCQSPPQGWFEPGESNGYRNCTTADYMCDDGSFGCFYCFDGGNTVVIEHPTKAEIYATRYDHLKKNSILVAPGDQVVAGQKIAEAASAGASTGPHLHFEVWDDGPYQLADPWAGSCGPNFDSMMWKSYPPWQSADELPPNISYDYLTVGSSSIQDMPLEVSGSATDTDSNAPILSRVEYVVRDLSNYNWVNTEGDVTSFEPALATLTDNLTATVNWLFQIDLPVGNYRIYTRGVDSNSNISGWLTSDIEVTNSGDLLPPHVIHNTVSGATIPDTPFLLRGSLSDLDRGSSMIDGGEFLLRNLTSFSWINSLGQTIGFSPSTLNISYDSSASASWEVNVELTTGEYRLYVRGSDAADNVSQWSHIDFTVISADSEAPLVVLESPQQSIAYQSPTVFEGQINDDTTGGSQISSGQYLLRNINIFEWVDLLGNEISFSPQQLTLNYIDSDSSSWQLFSDLVPNHYRLYIRGEDIHGNRSSWKYSDFEITE